MVGASTSTSSLVLEILKSSTYPVEIDRKIQETLMYLIREECHSSQGEQSKISELQRQQTLGFDPEYGALLAQHGISFLAFDNPVY